MFFQTLFSASLLFAGINALPSALSSEEPAALELVKRQSNSSCTHGPTDRACWSDGFDINTNWYNEWPDTGVVREYWLEVTNTTASPDGFEKQVLTFNNTFPGPTITADWGDTVKIHVTNKLTNNGTSIHWHGIRQLGTVESDGVNGVTQCPIAPGDTMTYEWQATQYGTTWYHSHFSLQYGEGVMGKVVINGPASANYDEDLGAVFVQDWYHHTIFSLWESARTNPNPLVQTGLINGTGVYDDGGSYWETTIQKGNTYRLRFVNTAVDTMFKLELDNHNFTVIAADLVPIEPYVTHYLTIGMGQRYDVIIDADQAVDNYWFRAYVQTSCSSTNENTMGIRGIIRYEGADTTAEPTTSDDGDYVDSCADEPLSSLVPIVKVNPDQSTFANGQNLDVSVQVDPTTTYFFFYINDTSIDVDWADPVLNQVAKSETIKASSNTFTLNGDNSTWVYFTITTSIGLTHPIHLHGHDFSIIAQGALDVDGNPDLSGANFDNPMRRDVAMLPASGFLTIGFPLDNPGSWIMHCHIAWHISEGLGLNFLERPDDLVTPSSQFNDVCDAWSTYDTTMVYPQDDSGLRRF